MTVGYCQIVNVIVAAEREVGRKKTEIRIRNCSRTEKLIYDGKGNGTLENNSTKQRVCEYRNR